MYVVFFLADFWLADKKIEQKSIFFPQKLQKRIVFLKRFLYHEKWKKNMVVVILQPQINAPNYVAGKMVPNLA